MTAHQITPLNLSGNTTESQKDSLRNMLGEALERVHQSALQLLDRHSAKLLLELDEKLKAEIVSAITKVIQTLTVSDKYKDEEAASRREYPANYRVRPIEAQVTELRKIFPQLRTCMEKLARAPLPNGAEAWFAIPRWQALAPTYNEAVEVMANALGTKRKFSNRIIQRMGPEYLRQEERTQLAESIIAQQQPGSDILVVAAQAGMLHRGRSARRARVCMVGNEFGLGAFAMGTILLTHPERLSHIDTLMIDCSGDEYSLRGDGVFDRVPLFDYDLSGIEFSIFYEDRARNLWGAPTGFTVQGPTPQAVEVAKTSEAPANPTAPPAVSSGMQVV